MYSPQALWTTARYRLAVLTVVLDNREYRILKRGLDQMTRPPAQAAVGMDLGDPGIDFVALAGSLGVAGRTVERRRLEQAVNDALASGRPELLPCRSPAMERRPVQA
jgi:benzoylformate decarboxylase